MANRPPNHGCSRSQATVSAPSSISCCMGSNVTPPEPNTPRQWQDDLVAGAQHRGPQVGRHQDATAIGKAHEEGAAHLTHRGIQVSQRFGAVAHREPHPLGYGIGQASRKLHGAGHDGVEHPCKACGRRGAWVRHRHSGPPRACRKVEDARESERPSSMSLDVGRGVGGMRRL